MITAETAHAARRDRPAGAVSERGEVHRHWPALGAIQQLGLLVGRDVDAERVEQGGRIRDPEGPDVAHRCGRSRRLPPT